VTESVRATEPRWGAPIILSLVLQAAGCAQPTDGDIGRENAAIAARIDHRLGAPGDGARERMAFSRRRWKTERVACVAVTRGRSRPIPFIYRSGCLYAEDDLAAPVWDRWRRDFCDPTFPRQGSGPPT
jgi:hypothetical protein